MSYIRVVPRDLFNEGNLLKCYGQLALALENFAGDRAVFAEDAVESFDIQQDQDSGALTILNLPLIVADQRYKLTRPLNSRRPYPLWVEGLDDPDFDPIEVFTDDGKLTPDMQAFLTVG